MTNILRHHCTTASLINGSKNGDGDTLLCPLNNISVGNGNDDPHNEAQKIGQAKGYDVSCDSPALLKNVPSNNDAGNGQVSPTKERRQIQQKRGKIRTDISHQTTPLLIQSKMLLNSYLLRDSLPHYTLDVKPIHHQNDVVPLIAKNEPVLDAHTNLWDQ